MFKQAFLTGLCLTAALPVAHAEVTLAKDGELKPFTAIEAGGKLEIVVVQGEKPNIELLEGKAERVKTKVRNGVLHVRVRSKSWFGGGDTPKIRITAPSLKRIDLSGAIEAKVGPLKAEEFELNTSGATELELTCQVKTLEVESSGASEIEIEGKAEEAKFKLSGAGELKAANLTAKRVSVRASGASEIEVNAQETLKVRASGASEVTYRGQPKLTVDTSGAVTLRQAGSSDS